MACSIVVLSVVAILSTRGSVAAAGSARYGDLDGGTGICIPVRPDFVDYIDSTGGVHSHPGPGYATRFSYHNARFTGYQIQPPAGWNPVTASDVTLRAFGIPPRPTDPRALAEWNDAWSKAKSFGPSGQMCQ